MQISEKIRPLTFRQDFTGKILSISRRTYFWTFEHLDHTHELALTIYLMSQKFKIEFDSKLVDLGYRPLVGKLKYQTNVHDLNLQVEEGNQAFDLYINGQRFVPGSQITVVDSNRTHYLQVASAASRERIQSEVSDQSPHKVLFGTEELIQADKILRSNTDTTNKGQLGFQANGVDGSRSRPTGSQSPGRNRLRTASREFLKSPLNHKITILKPMTVDNKSLPPLPPLPQPKRAVFEQVDNFFDQKADNWFFDVHLTPRALPAIRSVLKMGDLHPFETQIEIYLPISFDDRSGNQVTPLRIF